MQITLNQDEIHEAVENYVRSQINIADGQSIDIDFTAGRGPNGLSATLQISAAKPATASTRPAVKAVDSSIPIPPGSVYQEKGEPEADGSADVEAEAEAEAGVEPDAPEAEPETAAEEKAPKVTKSPFSKKAAETADAEDDAASADAEEDAPAPKKKAGSIFSREG